VQEIAAKCVLKTGIVIPVPVKEGIMKLFLLSIFAFLLFGSFSAVSAKQIQVQINNETRINGLRIKFIDMIEDSRCPTDTQCIWAGNAKITIGLSSGGRSAKQFELNSNLKPKSIVFSGYEIKLVKLTPVPRSNIRIRKDGYVVTLSVVRKR
jgi:hypothetical protein